ncbi:hypothetical protein BD311DRAFT_683751 [Dichomitus squalens]|uniref:Secreted protein n=1 Tax=Dichomitus squalens TaxID=114155 RepID=A0A4Q9N1J2_9APHY|nr:hypothetical protein BD311DRAFT_683751 [Dichomitus squalens]
MNTDQKQDHTAYQEPQAIQEPGAPPGSVGPGQYAELHAEQVPVHDPQDTGYTTNEHPHEKAQAHPATSIPLVAPPSHGGAARSHSHGSDDPADPGHYTRDPHKLIAYLIPFPKPSLKHVPAHDIPDRFLIYTPPPPPLTKPPEGEKEAKLHKVQRKWQEEVREAKMSDAKAPGLNELVLVYPSTSQDSPEAMRTEFVNSMLRTKSKAQKDAVIATSLIPVAFAVDVLATLIWPFGGLAEIDGVWAYASFRGAKVARSTTKRLQADESGDEDGKSGSKSKKEKHLKLTFTPSARVQTLARYLAARCHERDPHMFPPAGGVPTETEVLEAIGWAPSQTGEVKRNWEEEQWEMAEVKDDFKQVMQKGAKEWEKWCKAFEKNPKKALKK